MAKNKGYGYSINLPISIPHDWITDELGNVCIYIKDGDWIETKDQGGNDYRLLQISNIGVGSFIETGKFRWITEETYSKLKCTQIKIGDILIARMPEPTGRSWYVSELPWPAITAVDVAIVRTAPEKLDGKFLSHFLNSPYCLALVDKLTIGTTRKRIRRTDIEKLMIPIPPLPEQRAIAGILSSLNDKIDLLHRQNQTLEALAQTLFRQWFIEEAEDDWEERPLDEIAYFLNGLACQKYPPKNEVDKLPVLKIKELRNGVSDSSDWASTDIPGEYIVRNGDVIFSWSGSLLVKIWDGEDCILNQHLFKVTSSVYPKWFYYFWTKNYLQEFISIAESKSTTMGHIKRADLTNSVVLIPTHKELQFMNKLISPLLDKIINNNKQIRTLREYRDLILPKLMSGDIRVM